MKQRSDLAVISVVFEKVVVTQLVEKEQQRNSLIEMFQPSCAVLRASDSKLAYILVLVDISSAFKTVDYSYFGDWSRFRRYLSE